MIKKIHNWMNFGIIGLVLLLISGVFYTVLSHESLTLIKDISAVVAVLAPEASMWLDAFTSNIYAIQSFYNIIFLSLFTIMMAFFIIIPAFNLFINRKKELRISRLGLSMITDLLMIVFLIKLMSSYIFNSYFIINMFGFIILLVIILHVIISIYLVYKWYLLALERKNLGFQLVNTLGFLVKVASLILIVYFTTNIAFVIASNLVVDSFIANIHIAQMIGSNIVEGINFDVPLKEILPESITTFFTNNGFTLNMTLTELGITTENVNAILNSYVFTPVDSFIHNMLNDFTNRFIFKDFSFKILVLLTTIAMILIYKVKLIPIVIRQIAALISLSIITFTLLFVLNYFMFINIIIILLLIVILLLVIAIIKYSIKNKQIRRLIKRISNLEENNV